jgi:hypothetical protein
VIVGQENALRQAVQTTSTRRRWTRLRERLGQEGAEEGVGVDEVDRMDVVDEVDLVDEVDG